MDVWIVLTGLLVGIMIGVTGMGGGLIMTPLLIFGFGVPPAVAVGTDLIFAATTKLFGILQHVRQKTIDFPLLRRVMLGSIPGTIVGLTLLYPIKAQGDTFFNLFIAKALAIVFLLISAVILVQIIRGNREQENGLVRQTASISTPVVVAIGFLIGLLVAITSVGSGSLFIALLILLYPLSTSALVGTDILHGIIITGIAGIAHSFFGTIDFDLAGHLLLGSIPGVLLGSKFIIKLPDRYIRTALIIMLSITSMILLFK